ncbi:hypothetical protein Syun_029778 [Stephania yunnanensis]|uniref:Uncharacterized protein n=1 Tax=Stephania yunnanensis TaxID=152371 RepID=A0AAP0EEI6_9MAGN
MSRLRFDRSHRVEAEEFFGGSMGVLNDDFAIKILCNNSQFIHMKIVVTRGQEFLFTTVYGNPNRSKRQA